MPRALFAPGESAVCPTSTTRRNAIRSQAEAGNFVAAPSAGPAQVECHASGHATSAATTVATSPTPRRKAINVPRSPSPRCPLATLIGLRQPQNLLCDEIEDHMWRNRRNPRDERLAQIALDV